MATKRSDGIETRKKLLAAAAGIFAKTGFRDAKVAEICRMAGANIASVNYYFGNKESLYVEAWRDAFERSIALYPPDGGIPKAASTEERLRGCIHALVHRIMDPDSVEFDIGHREFSEPTGLLGEVMHRSLEPLRLTFISIIHDLLGPTASPEHERLCEMSVHAQCFHLLRHKRQLDLPRAAGKSPCPPMPELGADDMAEYIFEFSLAGIHRIRELASTGKTSQQKESKT